MNSNQNVERQAVVSPQGSLGLFRLDPFKWPQMITSLVCLIIVFLMAGCKDESGGTLGGQVDSESHWLTSCENTLDLSLIHI